MHIIPKNMVFDSLFLEAVNLQTGLGGSVSCFYPFLEWDFILSLPMPSTVRYIPKNCDNYYTKSLDRILLLTQHHIPQMRNLGVKLFALFPRLFLNTKKWHHTPHLTTAWSLKAKRQTEMMKSRFKNFLNGRFSDWLAGSLFASQLGSEALRERILVLLGPSLEPVDNDRETARRNAKINKLVGHGYISKAADKVSQDTQQYQLHDDAVVYLEAKFPDPHDLAANDAALHLDPEIANPESRVFIDPFNRRGQGYKNLRNAIRGLKKQAAPGMCGWTTEMFRHFLPTAPDLGGNRYQNTLLGLTKFFSDIEVRRDFEPGFLTFLASGRGFTLPKGGVDPLDVRPIVAPSTIWKMFASATMLQFKDKLLLELKSTNFACGMPLGTEVMHHLTRDYLLRNPAHVIAQLDFSNGFNSVKRSAVLAAIAQFMPHLYHIAVLSMGGPEGTANAKFWKANGDLLTIDILEGVRQGDPLSMAFFCLATHAPWKLVQTEFPDLFQAAYADDCNIGGTIANVAEAIPRIAAVFAERTGLVLNMTKLKLYSTLTDLTLAANKALFPVEAICIPCTDGIMVMGAPIGSDAYTTTILNDVVYPRIATFIKKVVALPNTQAAYHILRLSGIPRVTHLVRLIPPSLTAAVAARFDALFLTALDTLAGVPEGTFEGGISSKEQARWPLRHSGLGFTSFDAIKETSYFASTAIVGSLLPLINPDLEHNISLNLLLPENDENEDNILPCGFLNNEHNTNGINVYSSLCWIHMFDNNMTKEQPYTRYTVPDATDLTQKPPKLQRAYLDEMYTAEKTAFLADADTKTKARLNATGTKEGRLIFVKFPTHTDTQLTSPQFRYAFCERAGVGVPDAYHPKCRECACTEPLHPPTTLQHIDSCNEMSGRRTVRHNCWQQKWRQFFTYCNHRVASEYCAWKNQPEIPDDEEDARGKKISQYRADLVCYQFNDQTKRLYDVSIANPCSGTDEVAAAAAALAAATRVAKKKKEKYSIPSERIGYTFVPLVAETFGAWDKDAKDEVRYMISRAHAHRGIDITRGIKHWMTVLTFVFFS